MVSAKGLLQLQLQVGLVEIIHSLYLYTYADQRAVAVLAVFVSSVAGIVAPFV
ncbi:hypothetical protein [Apibacter raozihei]|uniref:hypothetical protein n=1 Tax=Apibacter raozihei TaxID=2500547 RepID=UPI001E349C71|nr:hypothetical protein [Apibacter raozihei]